MQGLIALIFYIFGGCLILTGCLAFWEEDIVYDRSQTVLVLLFCGFVIIGLGRIIGVLETISIRLANDTHKK